MDKVRKPIRSFHDLDVYQSTYRAMLQVFKHILPKLPKEEEYDLKSQLRRSTKAIPRLIAEGHSKRHQKKGFQKYLDDAMAESNETIVSLSQARDLYSLCIDTRSHLKKASKAPWRRCGSAQNAHILPCMLRFFAAPRLALNPDSPF